MTQIQIHLYTYVFICSIDGKWIFCSNVGECVCSKCECPADYTEKYCECNNKACGGYISTGELCNGRVTLSLNVQSLQSI